MHKLLLWIVSILAPIGVVSCKTQVKNPVEMQKIELRSEEDRFLANFVEAGPEGLSVAISREEALFAGATAAGYADLERQVARINAGYDAASYDYWKQAGRQQQSATKTNASFEGTYDKYNTLDRDKFLENFVYVENGEVVLKISEERAVLCGATVEGYRAVLDGVADLNRMVQAGDYDCDDVRECFDAKREYILSQSGKSLPVSKAEIQEPPETYATVELVNGDRQRNCSFYGSDSIICAVTGNSFAASAIVQDLYTLQTLNHMGFSSHKMFKACLTYPEGGHYSFLCTKTVDSYDVTIRFVEYH
ncbi:Uncharacterised protein [Rikenella microfusus]|uniref:Lipoprotein n=2 Tax=Rikenella microfusus TaxID=28139 RepID=A0A379MSP5_9BACT|nr:Uncharacterised protein [Rikenella microfusus]